MKKNFLIYQIIFSFFILSLPSCINQDFDLDDDKLDTNVTLGSGISLPVGDIEEISIYDELKKVCDSLKFGEDSVLYVEYRGTFPVEFPALEIPEIKKVNEPSPIPGLTELSGMSLSSLLRDTLFLINNTVPDMMTELKLGDGDFTFNPRKIEFSSFTLKVGFELSGISLAPADNNAEIVITLTFPENYELEGESLTITKNLPFKLGYNSIGEIKVKSYTFGDKGNLTYSAVLKKGNATSLTAENPIFTFILEVDSPNPPEISNVQCSLSGEKEFIGTVAGFGDLQNAFGDGDTLEFSNPSLYLGLTTNLDADFKLGLNLSRDDGISATPSDMLIHEKSGKADTSYVLTKTELVNFDKIISTPFPNALKYAEKLIFDNPHQEITLPSSPDVSANYSFKIPFAFDKISLSLKETLSDLFNEDIYDQIFSHIDDVAIVADLDVNIGGGDIKLDIKAVILDADSNEIPELASVTQSSTTLSITINDMKQMKEARHLELTFRLSGGGAIKESDYIRIKNLRLISASGIHYEF